MDVAESLRDRKSRGAFYTPLPIAQFIVEWAIDRNSEATVLDPTCGGGVFLESAARKLEMAGVRNLGERIFGIDIHKESADQTRELLASRGAGENIEHGDFLYESTPAQLNSRFPYVDAVVGNPPFIRYQNYKGDVRRRAVDAAEAQGVSLSGLTSSWAPVLVHASAFLKADGVLAFVLPAELLSVGYAEPIRRWLKRRFASVHLVMFDDLQFMSVDEQVVILIARGSGGCRNFTIHHVRSETELKDLHPFDAASVTPPDSGKWTALILPDDTRDIFQELSSRTFGSLTAYGRPTLQTVTGANSFFVISDNERVELKLREDRDVIPIVPPGSRNLFRAPEFTRSNWDELRASGERVWLISPSEEFPSPTLWDHIRAAEEAGVNKTYKTRKRSKWWRVPVVEAPDMFFTYMSVGAPRIVANPDSLVCLNSLLGISLVPQARASFTSSLPILALNSATALGAELFGRTFGGGLLKMEPSEASALPTPVPDVASAAWQRLDADRLRELITHGQLDAARGLVDEALLIKTIGMSNEALGKIRDATSEFRRRRRGK